MAFNGLMQSFTLCVALVLQVKADVREPASIVEKFPENSYIFRDGNAVVLPCKATGSPLSTYQWLKNGENLDVNVRNILISTDPTDGSLTIDPPSVLDEGYYQCIARNTYGTSMSNVVYLQIAALIIGNADGRPYSPIEGDSLIVQCNPPRKSVPKPSFTWALASSTTDSSPKPYSLSKRVKMDSNGNLYFSHVVPSDAQDGSYYKCNAFNAVTDTRAGSSYSTINVIPNPGVSDIAPQLMERTPSDTVVLLGETLELYCLFSGKPTPDVSWKGPRNKLPPNRHTFRQFYTELLITDVTWEDEGIYRCRGTNGAGNTEAEINIKVEEPPSFTELPVSTNFTVGEDAEFSCKAEGKPKEEVTWYINGKPLHTTAGVDRVELSADKTRLTFKNLCKECSDGSSDLRVLQCNASNVHGYVFADAYLNVLEPTVILNGPKPVTIAAENATEIRFDCEASSDDSTPVEITWHQNDKLLVPDSDSRLRKTESNSLLVNLTGLEGEELGNYRGNYRCTASNGYSSVQAETPLTVILPVPTGLPEVPVTGDWDSSTGNSTGPGVEEQKGGGIPLWLLILLAIIAAILLLILILCCCWWCRYGRKVDYKVDKKERAHGRDPVHECNMSAFMVYHKPEIGTLRHNRAARSNSRLDSYSDSGRGSNDNLRASRDNIRASRDNFRTSHDDIYCNMSEAQETDHFVNA